MKNNIYKIINKITNFEITKMINCKINNQN